MKRFFSSALLALALTLSMTPNASAASAFNDVPDTHWASGYIQQAYEQGWINGMSQNTYAPSETLTRAQFLKMIATAFYPQDLLAADVPGASPWYAPTWTVIQNHQLQSGTSMAQLSDLTGQISRYDMAQIISNMAASKNITASNSAAQQSSIQDWNSIPQNYQKAVSNTYALGILNGKNGSFAGQDTTTRAEAAAVLCRMSATLSGGSGTTAQTPNTQTPSTQKPSTPSTGTQTPTAQTPSTPSTPSTQTPATQTPSTGTQTPEQLTAEVVRLVNVERAKEGLPALGTYDSLTKAAAIRAPELISLFSHTRPDGSSCFTALDATGASKGAYTYGENIAAGNATAAATVEQWMNSPGHRANILNKDFTHIGVGYTKGGSYGHCWVQMFVGTTSVPDGSSNQKPSTQTPSTQTPSTQTPSTQNPSTQTPSTQTPSTQTPSTQTPSTQKPSTQTPSTQTPSTPSSTPEELAAEVVRLVNVERAKEGLPALGTYDSLTKAAEIRAPELVSLFSHTRPDGSSCFTALDATGAKKGAYTYGENIAAGNATAAATVEQWMNSPGHRANILNKDFTHIGVAYTKGGSYGHCWVQMFVGTTSVPDGSSSQKPSTQTPSTQKPSTQTPDTQTPSTQTPSTQTPNTQRPSTQTPDQTESGGVRFSRPVITLSPRQSSLMSTLDEDFRSVSDVTFTNESPELLRVNGSTVSAIGETGTGYVTVERNGHKARLTVRIIPLEDQINLSCLSLRMGSNSYGTTELYVFSSSKFYGEDIDVTWSVDDPSILTLEEQTSSKGNPSVRFSGTGTPGDACITCRVTMADGSSAEEYCYVNVYQK